MTTSEFKDLCDRLKQNDPRLKAVEMAFYYRYCSLLSSSSRSNETEESEEPEQLLMKWSSALAGNHTLETLAIDGALLFHSENADHHLRSIMQHLIGNRENLRSIHLRWCGNKPELLEALALCPQLTHLHIHEQEAINFEGLLSTTQSIQRLTICCAGHGFVGIGAGLSKNKSVQKLELTGRALQVEDICDGLIANSCTALKSIKVKIDSEGQAAAIQCLLSSSHCQIEELDLSNSNLRDHKMQERILSGLAKSINLRKLTLDHSNMRGGYRFQPEAWHQAFENSALTSLDLACHVLQPDDAVTILEAVQKSPMLVELTLNLAFMSRGALRSLCKAIRSKDTQWTKLSVSDIEIMTLEDAEQLKESLLQNNALQNVSFPRMFCSHTMSVLGKKRAYDLIIEGIAESVSIDRVSLDMFGGRSENVRSLFHTLSSRKQIKYLALRDSHYEAAMCDGALSQFLRVNRSIKELDLSRHNTMEQSTVQVIADGLLHNTCIEKLCLQHCQTSEQDWKCIVQALETNQTLQMLDIQCLSASRIDGERVLNQFQLSMPRIHGLRQFFFHGPNGFPLESDLQATRFLDALDNHCHQLEAISVNVASRKIMESLDFQLLLNQSGRRLVRSVPAGDLACIPELLSCTGKQQDYSATSVVFSFLKDSVDKWTAETMLPVKRPSAKPEPISLKVDCTIVSPRHKHQQRHLQSLCAKSA